MRAGEFVVQTVGGPVAVAGWISDDFALDFRVFGADEAYGAWHVSHLLTGHSVCHIEADFKTVVGLIDKLRLAADWSFSEPDSGRDRAEAFCRFRDENAPLVKRGQALFSPATISPASAIEARSDATGTGAAEGESATLEEGDAHNA